MKFSFTKEALQVLKDLDQDERFFQRNWSRIQISKTAIKISEMQRVGQIRKNMDNIDLEAGTFETKDIIIAKDLKNVAKPPQAKS